ncbi:hypothetical protein BX600DRAFT_439672 [Xylariales sp. PMI_506]|nr:hypothetical protein BX600DRAFT_439672 [Xylariales sp. PMI_506]
MKVRFFLDLTAVFLLGSRCLARGTAASSPHSLKPRQADINCSVTTFQVSSPPFENYFLSDCHSAAQVVVTSALPDTSLSNSNARIIVAWPAGNSGIVAYFGSSDTDDFIGIELLNSTIGNPLGTIYVPSPDRNASAGISTEIGFNTSATLNLLTLGSIRTIRDGPSNIYPQLQAMDYVLSPNGTVTISRLWLDNITTTQLSFTPTSDGTISIINGTNITIQFDSGTYILDALFDYPQLQQIQAKNLFTESSYDLIRQDLSTVNAIQFLSYDTKILAGGWHYLTYFGRDSMISALLLEPILSKGNNSAMEAIISAVIDRLNTTDGSVCHEETIGDYATWTNIQDNITSTAPLCTYLMIDTDYYLPILMAQYFVENPVGSARAADFLSIHASFYPNESHLTYGTKALKNAQRVMELAAPFAAPGNRTVANLIHLKDGQPVGQWRDSNEGLGGGRIPFDVNTALMPAALRAIGKLARAEVYNNTRWCSLADEYAAVWETSTLQLFEVTIPEIAAKTLVTDYVNVSSFGGPSQADLIDGDVEFYGLALNDTGTPTIIRTMHSDTSFRVLLINDTNDAQAARFLNNTAKSVMRTFPAGLLTNVGMLIANPAYGGNSDYSEIWTTSAYHGTVVWSFQLAMMARGIELQVLRCNETSFQPAFCRDESVMANIKTAYNLLWDSIQESSSHSTNELWSWKYENDTFQFEDYSQAAPGGEGDAIQLWSLTFLAVKRNINIL